MRKITLEKNRCPQNHWCPVMRVCPTGAITQASPFDAPEINDEKCVDCGKCSMYCAFGAFKVVEQVS